MTTIDKIRAEIKKLQDIFVETAQGMETEDEATVYSMCAVEFGDELLSFLDTMPDEPVTDCHELEEAAEAYSRQVSRGHNYRDLTCGFIAGAEWMKTKMMEGAVEGVVWGNVGKNINISVLKGVCKYLEQDDLPYNVRIIILPKEEDNDRTIV